MYQVVTSEIVKVNITNSGSDAVAFEKKLDKSLSIEDLKVLCYIYAPHRKKTLQSRWNQLEDWQKPRIRCRCFMFYQ